MQKLLERVVIPTVVIISQSEVKMISIFLDSIQTSNAPKLVHDLLLIISRADRAGLRF